MTVQWAAPDDEPAVVHKHPLDLGQARERERRTARKHTSALFDEALHKFFPAGDPIAVTCREQHST